MGSRWSRATPYDGRHSGQTGTREPPAERPNTQPSMNLSAFPAGRFGKARSVGPQRRHRNTGTLGQGRPDQATTLPLLPLRQEPRSRHISFGSRP